MSESISHWGMHSNESNIESRINAWATEKGIHNKSLPKIQLRKTLEEVEELREAVEANDYEEIVDGIGDVGVTLVILAKMYNTSLEACMESAYNVIKNRTGKMVDGMFVKDK